MNPKKTVLNGATLVIMAISVLWPSGIAMAAPPGDVTDLKLASLRDIVETSATGCYVASRIDVKNVGDLAAPYEITVTLATQTNPSIALYTEVFGTSDPLPSGEAYSYTLWTSNWTVVPDDYLLTATVSAVGDANARNDSRTTRATCR